MSSGNKPVAASHEALKKALPAPGKARWWQVELRRGSTSNPIKISLMESIEPGSKSLSTVLMYRTTRATVKSLAETAEEILVEVGDYEKLIGDYGLEQS